MSAPTTTMRNPREHTRADYRHFLTIATRWMDNDMYGHVNNVTYYSYFDTIVNEHLISAGGLDIFSDAIVGYVVETICTYHRPISFPESVDAALRIVKLGRSSVVYEIALFRQGDHTPAATGRFVHVWVNRETETPAQIPARIREALLPLLVTEP